MTKLKKEICIDAPVERVYEYLTTPDNLPEFWPSLMEVNNVKKDRDGSYHYDWVYKMAGMRFYGHSDMGQMQPCEHAQIKNETGIPSRFEWSFERDGSSTKVTLDVDYTLPNKLLQKLAAPVIERINDHEADVLLSNAKARLELNENIPAPVI